MNQDIMKPVREGVTELFLEQTLGDGLIVITSSVIPCRSRVGENTPLRPEWT